jgi:hypothetical protein
MKKKDRAAGQMELVERIEGGNFARRARLTAVT